MIVVQHATQALLPSDGSDTAEMARFGVEESVSQALVRALFVVMRHEFVNRFA
jgi:hypothetical protein